MHKGDLHIQNDRVQMRWLDQENVDQVMDLQNRVCNELKRIGHEHFFVPLSRDARLAMLKQNQSVAGLYENDQLVAHMVFFRLSERNLLKDRYHSLTMQQPQASADDYYLISEMVAPECRRRGYMSRLADWAMSDLYFESPALNPNIWATVSCINMGGLHCNLKLGLRIQEEGLNLVDGTSVYLLHGKLLPKGIQVSELKKAAA